MPLADRRVLAKIGLSPPAAMKTLPILTLIAAGLGLVGCQTTSPARPEPSSPVTVEFQNPEKFRDVRDSLGGDIDQNALATLRTYLQENAPAHLEPGQKLRVTFTDIDLAGDFPTSGSGRYDRVRLIRSIYVPRQEFSFEVTDASGQVVKEGKRTLTDLNFQANNLRIGSEQPYFYDKVLLEDWLRKEFK
jgi:hypothetical protein